jgi:hypothetical protein
VEYAFDSWSDGGALSHHVTVPAAGGTYTATFNLQYQLAPSVSPAGSGAVAPGAAAFYNAGSTVNLTAIPAAGYGFVRWSGAVASSTSATTSITMSAPETVQAIFALLPTTVNAALMGQSGPSSARVWAFSFTNAGPGQANSIEVTKFGLTQTAGTACKPTLISTLPAVVGSAAPNASINGTVSINFPSCPANAVFSLAMGISENGGASTSTVNLANLSQ